MKFLSANEFYIHVQVCMLNFQLRLPIINKDQNPLIICCHFCASKKQNKEKKNINAHLTQTKSENYYQGGGEIAAYP